MGKRKLQQPRAYGRLGKHARSFLSTQPNVMAFFPGNADTSQRPPSIPIKPKSQKEATMASEPSQELVDNVMAFTGADGATAVRFLKVKHNNLEQAVIAIIDNEDISRLESSSTWEENMFSADREGNDEDGNRRLKPLTAATAPNSRPPSRNTMHPSSKEEEDKDMAEAMAMSMSTRDLPFEQEAGVIKSDGTETKSFGPATREHYERDQWALVPRAISSGEIVPDADVEQRKNVLGEPRVIKHLPEGDYLANFLTICHSIAGAREAMLMRECVRSSYGQDGEWWRGHTIAMPRIVHTESGTPVEPDADKYDELIAEVQRLMAFLDASERSYASPGALTQTDAIKDDSPATTKSKTLLELFMQQWVVAASAKSGTQGDIPSLFTTHTVTREQGKGVYLILDLETSVADGEKADLSELTDDVFYDAEASDDCIDTPAEVLVMRLRQLTPDAKQLRVDVPAAFHMDKYLRENMTATGRVRGEISKGKVKIKKIAEIEKRLTTWKHPKKSEDIDAKFLLKHAHGHFSGQNKRDSAEMEMETDGPNGVAPTDETDVRPPHYQEIAEKLDNVIASIESKLTLLASEREKTRKAISEMSRNPLPELEGQLKHHYTLRGVATKPNITYILCQKEEDEDEDMLLGPDEDDDGTPDGMQWWRIEYEVPASGSGAARVTKTKTPDYDVLRAVELEHNQALLVYASDKINDILHHNPALPQPLQDFVAADNALFATELRAAAAYKNAQPPAYDFDVPRPSIEREGRGSMDSTRADGGDDIANIADERHSPPGYGQGGFMDHHGFGLGPMQIPPGRFQQQEQEKWNNGVGEAEGEVVEITLDDVDAHAEDGGGGEMEMVERVHEPLIPRVAVQDGDMAMEGVEEVNGSQDHGVGGDASMG